MRASTSAPSCPPATLASVLLAASAFSALCSPLSPSAVFSGTRASCPRATLPASSGETAADGFVAVRASAGVVVVSPALPAPSVPASVAFVPAASPARIASRALAAALLALRALASCLACSATPGPAIAPPITPPSKASRPISRNACQLTGSAPCPVVTVRTVRSTVPCDTSSPASARAAVAHCVAARRITLSLCTPTRCANGFSSPRKTFSAPNCSMAAFAAPAGAAA